MDKGDEKNKFCYEKFPYIEVLPIYRVHRVHEEQDGPVTGYAICYDMKVIEKHEFKQIFDFNKEVFKDTKELRKGKNILKIKNYLRKGEQVFFVVDEYSMNMKTFIEKK